MKELSLSIMVHEEKMENKKVFIVSNEELGISDFGDNLEEAIANFKKAVHLYLDAYPEKKKILMEKEEPVLISRIML